jgi:ArsR family metal-binding transcriptional regulator
LKGDDAMKLNAMEVLRELPRTNCKECGEPTCITFATKLLKKERTLEECKPLLTDEHAQQYRNLKGILQAV